MMKQKSTSLERFLKSSVEVCEPVCEDGKRGPTVLSMVEALRIHLYYKKFID
jgi:hypothetical protein